MKKQILLSFAVSATLTLSAQTDNPVVSEWHITDGTLGSYTYYPDPQNPTGAIFVQMTDTTDILNVCYDNTYSYVESNSLASYEMGPWQGNPNLPAADNLSFRFPLSPTAETGAHTEQPGTGALGLAINGVVTYGLSDARSYELSADANTGAGAGDWNSDAWISEGESMGPNGGGHAQQTGQYHYHATPAQLYTDPSTSHSPIVGYAFDGYPIYGPFGYANAMDNSSSITRIMSSYQLRTMTGRTLYADGSTAPTAGPAITTGGDFDLGTYIEDWEFVNALGDLDEYNGRTCVTPEYPTGTYAYFITTDNIGDPAFPYIIGLEFYGVVSTNSLNNQGNFDSPAGATCFDVDSPIPTSLADLFSSNSSNIVAYPNPIEAKLTLESGLSGTYTIAIYNALGQPVIVEIANTMIASVSLETLVSGVYLVALTSEEGITKTIRVVKQ